MWSGHSGHFNVELKTKEVGVPPYLIFINLVFINLMFIFTNIMFMFLMFYLKEK